MFKFTAASGRVFGGGGGPFGGRALVGLELVPISMVFGFRKAQKT